MKYRLHLLILGILVIIIQSCQPLTSIQIETIVPASIDFPGNFNKVVFVNLESDINNDEKKDTLLYNIITQEMSYGFMDAIQYSAGVDSSRFLFVRGFPDRETLYIDDTISWKYLEKISGNSNADIFIILDSLNMSMISDVVTEYNYYPMEYYMYRELVVNIYWSVYDLIDRRKLDQFYYNDTLLWDSEGYIKEEVEKKMPSVERIIREASYFAAADYANRIFPGWKTEYRYYYQLGNKDFKKASEFVKSNNWESAAEIWKNYVDDLDKEIASRACFNMAFAREMQGKLELALAWAEKSKEIKNKTRTRYYISQLKTRQKEQKKLQKQIY